MKQWTSLSQFKAWLASRPEPILLTHKHMHQRLNEKNSRGAHINYHLIRMEK